MVNHARQRIITKDAEQMAELDKQSHLLIEILVVLKNTKTMSFGVRIHTNYPTLTN